MNAAGRNYLVLGSKSWNRRAFEETIRHYPGAWTFIASPKELTEALVASLRPRYLFFLHWSWKVPSELTRDHECVCFHMTDVPYGRGGSPLQNLIVRGHRETKLTALRMDEGMDTGPVYAKRPLSLEGGAEEIFIRATLLAAEMIKELIASEPAPIPQTGDPTPFARRKPAESRLPPAAPLARIYDQIRMLDAEGYPPAYLDHGGFRYHFRRAALYDGRVCAEVTIAPIPNPETP